MSSIEAPSWRMGSLIGSSHTSSWHVRLSGHVRLIRPNLNSCIDFVIALCIGVHIADVDACHLTRSVYQTLSSPFDLFIQSDDAGKIHHGTMRSPQCTAILPGPTVVTLDIMVRLAPQINAGVGPMLATTEPTLVGSLVASIGPMTVCL